MAGLRWKKRLVDFQTKAAKIKKLLVTKVLPKGYITAPWGAVNSKSESTVLNLDNSKKKETKETQKRKQKKLKKRNKRNSKKHLLPLFRKFPYANAPNR